MNIARTSGLWVLSRVGADSRLGRRMIAGVVRSRGARLTLGPDRVAISRNGTTVLLRREQLILAPEVASIFDGLASAVRPASGPPNILDFRRVNQFTYHPLEREMYFCGFPDLIEPTADYLRYFQPGQGDTVFDLGANAVVMTVALAERVGPDGAVIAIEPDPGNFEALRLNTSGYANVTCLNVAVATTVGEAAYVAEGGVTSHLAEVRGHTVQRDSAGDTIACRTETLQSLMAHYGTPAFAKIDIEGMEIPVLRSGASLLASRGVHLALDTHHPLADGFTKDPVEKMLAAAGYNVRSALTNDCWMTWATLPDRAHLADD